MIISASRRTDIPAFYSDWFFNRVREGFVMVRNPINIHQISKITLDTGVVDCIVFWTKNPANMISRLHLLEKYKFYFMFTINPYGKNIELNVPQKNDVINTFIQLSKIIGKDKVIWRYDPIILTEDIDLNYHYKYFDHLAGKLAPFTNKCVISFLWMYNKTKFNLKSFAIKHITEDMKETAVKSLALIASKHGLKIVSCAESDFSSLGITPAKCIDPQLISKIVGAPIINDKDKNQREKCGCIASIDIGAYSSCTHNCLYCYANSNLRTVYKNISVHNPTSPLLFGEVEANDKISERKLKSSCIGQQSMF
ncbi:DUF1848 domain-containing protein [Dendrosporobacter sp. 1207_IL3150]|uniref:DUF1848 domain-containing protein n=1 Tax=Dendrosporobacter sp. 1207_IL3150 TaxID=3084054 RepID=UPI002FD99ECF